MWDGETSAVEACGASTETPYCSGASFKGPRMRIANIVMAFIVALVILGGIRLIQMSLTAGHAWYWVATQVALIVFGVSALLVVGKPDDDKPEKEKPSATTVPPSPEGAARRSGGVDIHRQ